MNEKDLVSVVVPVYNVEQYVGRCIEFLTAQTYSNIEIIQVDDGSRDKSGAICDQYSERDRRVLRFIRKTTGCRMRVIAGIEAFHDQLQNGDNKDLSTAASREQGGAAEDKDI